MILGCLAKNYPYISKVFQFNLENYCLFSGVQYSKKSLETNDTLIMRLNFTNYGINFVLWFISGFNAGIRNQQN